MVKPKFSDAWKSYVFDNLFEFIPNNAFTRAQMTDSGKVKNIHYGDILTKYGAYINANSKDIPYITKEIDLSRFPERCYLQSGDVIIADTAEDETVGKALEVINVESPVLAGQHTLLCRPKVRFAERFLGYYLNAACYHDQLLPYIVGTKVSSVSKASIAQTKLVVPEHEEQRCIADVLTAIDELIANQERLIAKKKAIKQGAMQELLTGKKRLPGFSGEWQPFVFGDLFDFIPNNAFSRAQMSVNGKVKNIHYGDILTKYGAYIKADSTDIPYIAKGIDLSRFFEKCYLQSGDVIIADTAEDETVGKALEVIHVDRPILAGQHTLLCRPRIQFAEKFLGYYLNAAYYHDQLLPYIVGTKVSSVSKASVAQTKLAVPVFEEQQAIASILADMDNEIIELDQKLAKYRQIKQGMMQQLLTGNIRLT